MCVCRCGCRCACVGVSVHVCVCECSASSSALYCTAVSVASSHTPITNTRSQVFETEHALAILDAFPMCEGHCLLIPKVRYSVCDADADADADDGLCMATRHCTPYHARAQLILCETMPCALQGDTKDVRDMSEDHAAKALSALPRLANAVTKATG